MFLDPNQTFNVYASSGKISQCDNALSAALNASLCVGCVADDGAVLVSYKKVSKLVNKESFNKVFNVCDSIGVTYSGLQPDFMVQLQEAQKLCQDYKEVYGKYPSLDTFMNEYSQIMIRFSNEGGLRPFGTYLLFVGTRECGDSSNKNMMFYMDPSSSFGSVEVSAAGVNYEQAKIFMERRRGCLDDNIQTALNALKEHVGVAIKAEDISVGVLKEGKFKVYSKIEKEELF